MIGWFVIHQIKF